MAAITGTFNEETCRQEALPQTAFSQTLAYYYSEQTARGVLKAFENLGLLAPEKSGEFLRGMEGTLVFLNDMGLVIRIDDKKHLNPKWGGKGVKDTPWIVQSIASVDVDGCTLEICPGSRVGVNRDHVPFLKEMLGNEAIHFWDDQNCNMGLLPLKIPQFPEGIPIVIDRGAVLQLSGDARSIKKFLKKKGVKVPSNATAITAKVKEAQAAYYTPLREALAAAWPDKSSPADKAGMQKFWELCRTYVQEEKLVAGWNGAGKNKFSKITQAEKAAEGYEVRMNGGKSSPTAATIPQSRRLQA